ncbi:DUF4194 domain-containing protein [Propionibacterium australiense]|uniref:DUF4194 domain-containing protein n=1 Tax=Propionibacterium australiense TaxID=119981 RepID=A0A383S6X0_9ACTN|nr:DUF4194 domain-containing protein [Propionibacterium australiense]RLP09676.1 DUF4194 domain-containing protein [Propionibacterium australiense]RLP12378.1 DUF4194 domain-containing protein [Propionibacterium australiense]SYZ33583.1 Protein of unknown function DUF4194 [Propionibacterium australiense]VEH89527.1 Uncharacterised protein [Propionibacterium australiense]
MTDLEWTDDDPNEHGDATEETSLAMFEGDSSRLFPEQRRCLHALLKHRYLSAEKHPEHWAVLMADTELIKSRLNDVFLDLHIDRTHRIAFKRQATADSEPLPTLLRASSHTKEETIVMVHLRRRFFTQRQEGDEAVFVDRQALLDEVADMRPDHATNRAMDQNRANKAIDSLVTAQVLLRTPDPDRFQISPVVEVLLPVEKLRALWTWLIESNQRDAKPDLDVDETANGLLLDTLEEST